MNILYQINYLFNKKLKIYFLLTLVVIMGGSLAELLGISIILPIVNLAMDENAIQSNALCRIITMLTGFQEKNQILIILVIITICVYIVKNVYLAWMAYIMNSFSKFVRQHFVMLLMQSYMKQPYAYFLNRNTAEIIKSINLDTVNLYTVISNGMQIISQGITAMLIVWYLAKTNIMLTITVATLLSVCALIIILVIQRKMRRMGKEYQDITTYSFQYIKQAYEGIKEVKMRNKENYFFEEYETVFKKGTEIEKISILLSSIPKYLIETICVAGIMVYLGIILSMGSNVTVLVPQLAVFTVGAFKLLPSVNALYTNISNTIYHRASIDTIYHDVKEVDNIQINFKEIEEKCILTGVKKEIVVKNISFKYSETSENVLENVSLKIKKGESIAFIGESGGGKTTLADIILGLLVPQQGAVYVDGVNIADCMRQWHENIGYISQSIFLLDDSIKNNIAFGIKKEDIDIDRVWKVLKQANLDSFVKGLEIGIDTMIGEAGARLSGGQRQRIGIARALYHNPEILVFDEATSALDTETEKEVMEAVEGLHGSKTMIMIAHRMSTIENCDHVYRVGNKAIEKVR